MAGDEGCIQTERSCKHFAAPLWMLTVVRKEAPTLQLHNANYAQKSGQAIAAISATRAVVRYALMIGK
jgi:hypothetical protein